MKQLIKIIVFLVIILSGALCVVYLFYTGISNKIAQSQNKLNQNWSQIYYLSMEREKFLQNCIYVTDSQKSLISLYNSNDSIPSLSSMDFQKHEFVMNTILADAKRVFTNNILNKDSVDLLGFRYSDSINYHSNLFVERYNQQIVEFNVLISKFPNNFISRRKRLKRLKRFKIKYGEENVDPQYEQKKFPEWAKDMDTSFLKK